MLQHCPTLTTGFGGLNKPANDTPAKGIEGTEYDSQNPRHAFVVMVNSTQSGIEIFLVFPTLWHPGRSQTSLPTMLLSASKNKALTSTSNSADLIF